MSWDLILIRTKTNSEKYVSDIVKENLIYFTYDEIINEFMKLKEILDLDIRFVDDGMITIEDFFMDIYISKDDSPYSTIMFFTYGDSRKLRPFFKYLMDDLNSRVFNTGIDDFWDI